MSDILRILIPIAVVHVVVLAVIIVVIKRLLLSDTMHAVQRLRQVEDEVRKKEEGIRQEIAEHEKEFEKKKAEAAAELAAQKAAMEKEVAREREQVLAAARQESDKILDQTRKNETKLKEQMARDIAARAVDYAGEVFKLVFSEKLGAEVNRQFTQELIDALAELDASAITVEANEVAFTSSHPMDAGQKEQLKRILKEKFELDVAINETVQEDLLAGLVFKLGSLEIDGSLRNRYQEAAEEVKKNVQV
jgi:F-type H+-transporting ATPase subunit b